MPNHFLCVDVSPGSTAFELVAIDLGRPMLDTGHGNYRILRGWFKDFVAEPELTSDGRRVKFYVHQDGARQHGITAEPVTSADLGHRLQDQVRQLNQAYQNAVASTAGELALHRTVGRLLRQLHDSAEIGKAPFSFFKYRDPKGQARLVWCWGYQRRDESTASARICKTPACECLLFAQKAGGVCPNCANAPPPLPVSDRTVAGLRRGKAWALAALLLLLGVGSYFGYKHFWGGTKPRPGGDPEPKAGQEESLVVSPETWSGPVGARLTFTISRQDKAGTKTDVRLATVAQSDHPEVLRIDPDDPSGIAASPGTTAVHFVHGSLTKTVKVEVRSGPPDKLMLEPERGEVAVHATLPLKAVGVYGDTKFELAAEAVNWEPLTPEVLDCYRGLVEGKKAGDNGKVRVRFRSGPDDPARETTADIRVTAVEFVKLEIAVRPATLPSGTFAAIGATAVDRADRRHHVLGSSQLRMDVDPSPVAAIEGERLQALKAGKATVQARFLTLHDNKDVEVTQGEDNLLVSPRDLALVVDQTADLSIRPAGATVEVTSSAPGIAESADGSRVIGRSAGTATITVKRGERQATVNVVVSDKPIEAISIAPKHATVPVDGTTPIRVLGRVEKKTIEITADRLDWPTLPPPEVAEFDKNLLQFRGKKPTGDMPQPFTAAYKGLRVSGEVTVVAMPPPSRVELTPAGPLSLPVGQKAHLQAWAHYVGRRSRLPADSVKWDTSTTDGLAHKDGVVWAETADKGPLRVTADYRGIKSNPVEINSVKAPPTQLSLNSTRTVYLTGESPSFTVSGFGPNGRVDLASWLARYYSSNPGVLAVDERTGSVRVIKSGSSTVTVTHPGSAQPVKVDFHAIPPEKARLVFRPELISLKVGQSATPQLVLIDRTDGPERETPLEPTAPAKYTFGREGAVQWKPPVVLGLAPAPPFDVTAEWMGLAAKGKVEVAEGSFREYEEMGLVNPEPKPGDITFQAEARIKVRRAGLEYGVVYEGTEGTWTAARPGGDGLFLAQPLSPRIKIGPKGTQYVLQIYAREPGAAKKTHLGNIQYIQP